MRSTITNLRRRVLLDVSSYRVLGMLVLIIILIVIVSLRNPHFLESENLRVIFMDTSILGIAAIAQLIVMLTSNIEISSSSMIAVSGFTSALMMKNVPNLNPVVVLLLGLLLGFGMGSFNGFVVAYGDVPSIIVTLGTLSVYRGINFLISGGGWVVSRDLPDSFRLISNGTLLRLPNIIVFFIVISFISYLLLNYTRKGRFLYAIGSNRVNAEIIGINSKRMIFFIFAVAGTLFGLSGVLWVSRYNFAQSNTAAGFELTVIAASVIGGTSVNGGRGTVEGVVLGAFLLSFIINAINVVKISPFWKMAIQGLIILIAVLFDSWITRRGKQ